MGKCKDCKWKKPCMWEKEGWFECVHPKIFMNLGGQDKETSLVWPTVSSTEGSSLYIKNDFGCILFEKK